MSLTAPERETIVTMNDEDELAEIWTAQRPWITKIRKNPSATLLEDGNHDGSAASRASPLGLQLPLPTSIPEPQWDSGTYLLPPFATRAVPTRDRTPKCSSVDSL